jgi:cytochrome c-type biogenesis protein CcmH/NrfF
LLAGAIMVWRYKDPFLLMPIAVTLWLFPITLALIGLLIIYLGVQSFLPATLRELLQRRV